MDFDLSSVYDQLLVLDGDRTEPEKFAKAATYFVEVKDLAATLVAFVIEDSTNFVDAEMLGVKRRLN